MNEHFLIFIQYKDSVYCAFMFFILGMKYFYKMTEHLIPKALNKKWREKCIHYYNVKEVGKFLRFYKEKLRKMDVMKNR